MKHILSIIITVLLFIGLCAFGIYSDFNDHEYVITITDKDRIVSDDSSKYLVFGESESGESLVFENTDTMMRGKFDSSNIQGELKVGRKYKITVIGFRVPFLSWYKNIIKVREVE